MSARRTTTGKARLTRRLEDYLEAVVVLVRAGGTARVRDIAARTDVSMCTVTAALKQLARAGLVNYDPYKVVTLTDRGRAAGERILAKHAALVDFLVNVLGLDPARAEANACRIEHVVDDQVLGRLSLLCAFLAGGGRRKGRRKDFLAYCRRHDRAAAPASPAGA